jgi:hypothetical protein
MKRLIGWNMKKEHIEYLETIEVTDTTATLTHLKQIREDAKREVEQENQLKLQTKEA